MIKYNQLTFKNFIMKKFLNIVLVLILAIAFTSCVTVRQGEVGVIRKFGKYSDKTFTDGFRFYNPLTSKMIKIPTKTENMEVTLLIPSKEGLTIKAEVSILYNVESNKAPYILRNIGKDYEENVILPVFRSAVSNVSARFYAKDMHTGERATIESDIKSQMDKTLDSKGLNIEAVLLKSIQMPASLSKAIEEKLEAEQLSQRMEFILNQSRQQAEQKRIEAEGIRDAQKIISEGLSREILQFKSIEAFLQLAASPNTKIIISDGDLPMLMDGAGNIMPSKINSNQ